MTDILMPALSPTMEAGTLARWLVKVGDRVKAGDVIAEVETDKASLEVESVEDGDVEALLVAEGAEGVKINTPIARLSREGDQAPPASRTAAEPAPVAPVAAAAPVAPRPEPTQGRDVLASPLARKIAGQNGLDLAGLKGSGPQGRIIRADVEAALGRTAAPQPAPGAAPPPSLQQSGVAPGSYDLQPLDGMRRTIARRLTDSFRDVPHFPLTADIEIDALLALRQQLNDLLEAEGGKVSLNDMIIKACAVALRRVPEANASYTPDGVALHHHADIAMAVAIDGGLITPIIRRADAKEVGEIARETKDLAERARARKLAPEEFQGGTFSISNLGMFGIRSFSSIINAPQGAILSVGAATRRPVVKDDALAIATVMTVTLTCDHRAIDGAAGAHWVQAFKAIVERPLELVCRRMDQRPGG